MQETNSGWIRLAAVWHWIDKRYGAYTRLFAGWVDPDTILAEALRNNSIRARGFGDTNARSCISFGYDQSAVTVLSARDEISLSVMTAARGAMMPSHSKKIFKEVEINESGLATYCIAILGTPLVEQAHTPECPVESDCEPIGRSARRRAPKRERANAMVKELFPEGVPAHYPREMAVQEVRIRLQAKEKVDRDLVEVSTDTIRRALGFRA